MKRLLMILLLFTAAFSAEAQSGTADTIFVDVPDEVMALRLQTTEYTALGKRDIERFGKRFLGYSSMQVWCNNGKRLERKKFKEIFMNIRNYPYDKIVFNGFVLDRLEMGYPTETGVIAGLLVGEKPVLFFRRKADAIPETE